MKIYTLSGLDGSGKSTQINKLKEYLEIQNQKVFEFHIIAFSFSQLIHKLYKKITRLPEKTPAEQKSVIHSGHLGLILRKIFFIVDVWRWKRLRKKLEKNGYDAVLSDRFFYDTLINIFYLQKTTNAQSFLEIFLPRDIRAIYLSAEPDDIMSHDRIPDQGRDYLIAKKELYDKKFSEWGLKKIMVTPSKDETFSLLKKDWEII